MNFLNLDFSYTEGDLFLQDDGLRKSISQLADQSYYDINPLLDRIYAVNDIAFVAKEGQTVVGVLVFSFKNRIKIDIGGHSYTAIYNGFAVTSLHFRNQKIMQQLIVYATKEFNLRINSVSNELLFYAITSNPYALRAYRKISSYMEPFIDGSFSEKGSYLVSLLKGQLGLTVQEDIHPFKFTSSLPQRYSSFEKNNLTNAPVHEKTLLENLNVVEAFGDRVILFWIPDGTF